MVGQELTEPNACGHYVRRYVVLGRYNAAMDETRSPQPLSAFSA